MLFISNFFIMINKKSYRWIRIAVAMILGMVISVSIINSNLFIALVAMIIAWIALTYLRSQVKEILEDERDYEIGGTAARWAIQIFSVVAVAFVLMFNTRKGINPTYETIAITLSYAVCFLMIVYSLIFKFYNRLIWLKGKTWLTVLGAIVLILMIVGGLRLLSGEDDWMCQNGQWVKHGHPSWPAPIEECNK